MKIFHPARNLGEIKNPTDDYFAQSEPEADLESKRLDGDEGKRNYWIFTLLSFFAVIILVYRLLNLQVIEGFQNQFLAQGNWLRIRTIPSQRGLVYDKKGNKLVENIPIFQVELKAQELPKKKEEKDKILGQISEIFKVLPDELNKKIDNNKYSIDPIILKENLSHEDVLLYETKIIDLPAISIAAKPARKYELDGAISHFMGYVGRINKDEYEKNPDYSLDDYFGKTGLEKNYEKYLSGEKGLEKIEVDSLGRYQRTLSTIDPKPGKNIVLSLDYNLQKETVKYLSESMKNVESSSAVAIAMNPKDGGLLSLVSLPSYDNNLFAKGISSDDYAKIKEDKNQPMINRAISGLYPSGSVIKPVIASAALQEGVVNEKTTIEDYDGQINIGEWVFPDWKIHGLVDIKKAISESCDVFFYTIGGGYGNFKGLGIQRINNYLEKFGFGEPTGIDLPGELGGLVPDEKWKKDRLKEPWYIGDTYHLSIGQGYFLTTPIQIVSAISAIANGGNIFEPHLVDHYTDYTGQTIESYQPKLTSEKFIDEKNLQVVREGMRQSVLEGTSRQLNDLPFASAGKTGTAQFGDKTKEHAWFVTFAPYENPEIAIVVMVEGGGEGYDAAEPVAKQMLKYYFDNKNN